VQSHPKAAKLKGFLDGEASRSQARLLVTHLLQGCSECAATVEAIVRPKREVPLDAYDEAFDKAYALIQAHLEVPRPLPTLTLRRDFLSLPGSPI
jgi:hypothetical protein